MLPAPKSRDESLLERASPGYRAARRAEINRDEALARGTAPGEPMTTEVGAVSVGGCVLYGGRRALALTCACHEGVSIRIVLAEGLAESLRLQLAAALGGRRI